MIDTIAVVTIVAGALTQGASAPQVIKTIRSKKTRDISLHFILQLLAGLSMWAIYGILNQDPYFLAWNTVGMSLWSILLFKKLQNMRNKTDHK